MKNNIIRQINKLKIFSLIYVKLRINIGMVTAIDCQSSETFEDIEVVGK